MTDAFGSADAPLLREIQRVLLSGTGPVNWELARQIAVGSATWGRDDPSPSGDDQRALEEGVRLSELAVAELTGMTPPAHVTHVRAIRRSEWIQANVRGLEGLFEPAADRLGRALQEARQEELAHVPPGAEMFDAMLGRLAPLLMGAQVGVVLGYLAQRVLGQYELPFPRAGEPALLFVVANVEQVEREWSLPPMEFRTWVALHETTHAFDLGRPWVRDHFLGLVREVADAIEFDLAGLEERLQTLDLSEPHRFSEALSEPGGLLGATLSEEQQLLLRRLQAFMAAAEGHADHVMSAVGRRLLPAWDRIEEARRRRHEGREDDERAIERLLGIDLKAEQYRLGRAFCDRVVELTDEATLARMWDGPDALPSMPELEEPRLWLARIA